MTKQKYQLGIQPTNTSKGRQEGALSKFIVLVEPILSAEEAVL